MSEEQDDSPPRDGVEPEPERESSTEPEAPAEGDHGDEFGDDVRGMSAAITHIHGPVTVGGSAVFGVSGGGQSGSRRATGKIPTESVDEALRWFVAPAEYHQASEMLLQHHVVVLIGPEGIGKRALALRLLRAFCPADAPFVSISPAATLAQLAGSMTFGKRQGYLVADHIGDVAHSAVRTYDADRLADKLTEHETYLVITATNAALARQLESYAVRVTAPDPVTLLNLCLDDAAVDTEVRELAEQHIAKQPCPRDVVRLAGRLVEDQAAAVEAMRDQSTEQVQRWFDGDVTKRDLLSVTVLAITGRQSESVHELLTEELVRHAEPRPGERDAAPYVAPEHERIEKVRRDHPLVVSLYDDEAGDDWLRGRRIQFRTEDMRPAVLRALHQQYGHRLWEPVRAWLRELSAAAPSVDIQVSVAEGLAMLAREDFSFVYRGFLDSWADGLVAERTTAAMVLWFMSADDQSAPVALRTAMSWGQDRGLHRAVSSALALGGPLGARYPGEALQRLCFLAMRAQRIGAVARLSVALLFQSAVEDGADSAASVLDMVYAELVRAVTAGGKRPWPGADVSGSDRQTVPDTFVADRMRRDQDDVEHVNADQDAFERGWNYRIVVAARWLVVAVLCAEQSDSQEPTATKIVMTQPDNVEMLGRLWADVLCSAPHAPAARRGLLRLLRALEHESAAVDAVARLGDAVRAGMAPAHRKLRTAELLREANRDVVDRRPSKALVAALLAAIDSPANTRIPTSARS